MKHSLKKYCRGALLAAILPAVHSADGAVLVDDGKLSIDDAFRAGAWEGTVFSGPMFSPFVSTAKRPTVNYVTTGVQFGYMLNEPAPGSTNPLRGNFELTVEGFGNAIFSGEGSYFAGGTLWCRYNFVQPNWRFVPFVQAGAGLTSTDANRYLLGQNFNFNLDLGAGTRYFLSSHWTVNAEFRFQHFSNANMARKNVGINAAGPIIGVSWWF